MNWKQRVVNLMSLAMIKRKVNIFFTIVRQNPQKAAEVFVTMQKHLNPRKEHKPKNSAINTKLFNPSPALLVLMLDGQKKIARCKITK